MRPDTAAHFLGGLLLALICWPLGPEWAFIIPAAVGAAKELLDAATGKGTPDAGDLAATAAGAAAVVVPAHWLGADAVYLLGMLWALWAFWALYVLMMGLYRALLAKRLGPVLIVLGGPLMVVAFALDFIAQVTVASLVFWQLPRHWLVTHRLRAYMAGPDGWRRRRAEWICTHMLDPIDPTGQHCDSDTPTLKA